MCLPFSPTDSANMYTLHTGSGHHDVFWRSDTEPHTDAQRWLRSTDRPGFRFRQPAPSSGDGWCRDRASQRHLSAVWRYCSFLTQIQSDTLFAIFWLMNVGFIYFFYSVSSHIKLVWFIHCILSDRPLLVYTLLVYQTISSSNIKWNLNFGGFYSKNAQYIVPVTVVRQYWLFCCCFLFLYLILAYSFMNFVFLVVFF